jgi:hypothetical protein
LAVDVAAAGGAVAAAGTGEGVFDWNQECFAGVGETAAGDGVEAAAATGDGSFLDRLCLSTPGEASALAAGTAGEVAAAGVASGAAGFFVRLCLATDGEASAAALGDGDWPVIEASENPANAIIKPMCLFISGHITDERPAVAMQKTGKKANNSKIDHAKGEKSRRC